MSTSKFPTTFGPQIGRRTLLKAGLAAGVLQVASPFIIKARGEVPIKIGLDDPFTGTYAELGRHEQIGCQFAVDELNKKGGILGRPVTLLSEDSTSADTGVAVSKAHQLIDRDKVNFLLGNVNSAMALALGDVSSQAGVLHIVTGGHTDAVTGKGCHWNVFRVCNTTRMETDAVSKLLFDKYGKKWYFITPDYAFGHTLQAGFEANLKKFGGTVAGASLAPLGTTDFSSYLIQAEQAKPDVILFLTAASSRRCSSGSTRSSISPARSRNWKCSKACRPTLASAPGYSNGTGSSQKSRMSPNSSLRSERSTTARSRLRATGSATLRSGHAR
jgi:branched-chain amino acid transport system substrate-binding protein